MPLSPIPHLPFESPTSNHDQAVTVSDTELSKSFPQEENQVFYLLIALSARKLFLNTKSKYLLLKHSFFPQKTFPASEYSLCSNFRYPISMPWNHHRAAQLKRPLHQLHALVTLILHQSIISLGHLLLQSRDVNR